VYPVTDPDKVRARVDSNDLLISRVVSAVGFLVAGRWLRHWSSPATLVGAAVLGAIPYALVVLVLGVRGVRRTQAGEIVAPQRVKQRSKARQVRARYDLHTRLRHANGQVR